MKTKKGTRVEDTRKMVELLRKEKEEKTLKQGCRVDVYVLTKMNIVC